MAARTFWFAARRGLVDHRVVLADLDTPLARCVAQIRGRRAARGRDVDAPLNEAFLRVNYHRAAVSGNVWVHAGGERRVVPVDAAVETIVGWLTREDPCTSS